MANLLVIESSFRGNDSNSRALTKYFLDLWCSKYPQDVIITRDLALNPLPHMDSILFGVWQKDAKSLSLPEQNALQRANQIIAEVQNANVVILGAPIYNFNISSNLKTWIEHLVRAGVAFKYTERGAVGLINNKKVFVIGTRGGIYKDGVGDFQTPYLKYLLNFIGITDITFINTQGLDMGEDLQKEALNKTHSKMQQLINEL